MTKTSLTKEELIELGRKYGFLNFIDHETPRAYFINDILCYTDCDSEGDFRNSVSDLYALLAKIYDKIGI